MCEQKDGVIVKDVKLLCLAFRWFLCKTKLIHLKFRLLFHIQSDFKVKGSSSTSTSYFLSLYNT